MPCMALWQCSVVLDLLWVWLFFLIYHILYRWIDFYWMLGIHHLFYRILYQ